MISTFLLTHFPILTFLVVFLPILYLGVIPFVLLIVITSLFILTFIDKYFTKFIIFVCRVRENKLNAPAYKQFLISGQRKPLRIEHIIVLLLTLLLIIIPSVWLIIKVSLITITFINKYSEKFVDFIYPFKEGESNIPGYDTRRY